MGRKKIENRVIVKKRSVTKACREVGFSSRKDLADMITECGYKITDDGTRNWDKYGWPPDAFRMLLYITGATPERFGVNDVEM